VALDPRLLHRRQFRPQRHPRDPPSRESNNPGSRDSRDQNFAKEEDVREHYVGHRVRPKNRRVQGCNQSRLKSASPRITDCGPWDGSSSSHFSDEIREELEMDYAKQPIREGNHRIGALARKLPPRMSNSLVGHMVQAQASGGMPRPRMGRAQSNPQFQRRGSLSASESSSLSSDAPIYSQEDSTYLLYGNADYPDWAELATDQNDLELQQIRRRFLRQDSSLSSNPSRTDSVESWNKRGDRMYLRTGSPDTEGLPAGFYRRKDGVIQSFGSSKDSSSKRSPRYTNEIKSHDLQEQETAEINGTESRTIDPGNSKDSTKYGTPMAWLPDSSIVVESTVSDTNNESTLPTFNDETMIPTEVDNNKDDNKGLVSSLVRSFEDTINEFRTGLRRSVGTQAVDDQNKTQTKIMRDDIIVSTAVSTVSTPLTIRKAKVKATAAAAAAVAAALAKRSTPSRQRRQQQQQIHQQQVHQVQPVQQQPVQQQPGQQQIHQVQQQLHHQQQIHQVQQQQQQVQRPQVPPVPSGWGFDPAGHPSFSESEGYDDSTITSKESRMPQIRAVVDVSHLPAVERPEYLEPVMEEQQMFAESTFPPSFYINRKMDEEENSVLQPHRNGESYPQNKQWHAPQPELYNPYQKMSSLPKNFAMSSCAYFPEPTRRGDKVPELVPGGGTAAMATTTSVVSDISSLPRSKMNNFMDFASMNGYGGMVGVGNDNITGFFDKMALALRLAVFQPNGCR
jgi:hypothetical protein